MEPQNSYVQSEFSAPLSEMQSPRQSPVSRATETFKAIMPAVATSTILGMSKTRFFTILLVVLLLGFAAFKLRPYLAYVGSLINLLRQLFTSAIGLAASTSTGIVDNTAAGTDVIVDKLSGTSKKQVRLPEPVKPESKAGAWTEPAPPKTAAKPPAPKPTKSPEPDDTTSAVQAKSGYCYVGDWKGVRSCVKVAGKCESGKVFDTEAACTTA
jgi:hypothetical protein